MATASVISRGCCAGWIVCRGLGVTAIWLMAFQPLPGKDDGYDMADYYGVDPRYGSLGDFVEFTHGCRQRGMRVIIDLVVNHTSNAHPWFRDARSSPDSQYRDWYVWADKNMSATCLPAQYDSITHARHRKSDLSIVIGPS
jgi:glycosidase